MIEIPDYLDSKFPLLFIKTDGGYLHISWEVQDEKILVIEDVPDNFPSVCVTAFDSLEEYLESICDVDWITDKDYMITYDDTKEQLTRMLYPTAKFLADWKGDSFYDLLSPGDMIDEEFATYFINVMPPAIHSSRLVQMGEPYTHVDEKPVYPTIENVNGKWFYRGNCFEGETKNQTGYGKYNHFYEINFYGEGHPEDWSFYIKSRNELTDEEVKEELKKYIYVDGLKTHHLMNIASINRITAEEFTECSSIEF